MSDNNLDSYNNVENLNQYKTIEELQRYRERRLEKYDTVLTFINDLSVQKKLNIVEIGSGNSGLLYGLHLKGLINSAVGIEIASSRYLFAEKWKKDINCDSVINLNKNFVDVNLMENNYDWFIVIDNTFSYLEPEDKSYPTKLLKMANNCLKEGGNLLVDVINYSKKLNDLPMNFWTEFPPTDPFKYGLYKLELNKEQYLRTKSVFIDRMNFEDVKVDVSCVYQVEQLIKLFISNGFKIKGTYADFSRSEFVENISDRLIVLAEKI